MCSDLYYIHLLDNKIDAIIMHNYSFPQPYHHLVHSLQASLSICRHWWCSHWATSISTRDAAIVDLRKANNIRLLVYKANNIRLLVYKQCDACVLKLKARKQKRTNKQINKQRLGTRTTHVSTQSLACRTIKYLSTCIWVTLYAVMWHLFETI